MAFSRSFIRHTLLWELPEGEKAACRFHWDNGAGVVALGAEAALMSGRADTFWSNVKEAYAPLTKFLGSRIQLIGIDGLVHETEEFIGAGVAGTEADDNLPTEVAICVSLRTTTISRRGRGRVFLPAPSTGRMTPAGRLYHPTRDDIAAEFAAMLADVVSGASTYVPCVASYTAQLLPPIVQIRVGDVYDVQRRRRQDLVESYQVVNL